MSSSGCLTQLPDDASFTTYAHYVICQIGDPDWGFYTLVTTFGTLVGFILVIIGFHRLQKHGRQQQMFRYHSPLATFFYLFSGVALLSYTGFFEMLSYTLFSNYSFDANPIQQYIESTADSQTTTEVAMQSLTYTCLIVIGVIAVLRGMVGLIKLGEGQGGSAEISSTIMYIVAGACGLNAQVVLSFFGIWSTGSA
ncbi:hypothetical protein L3V83_01720 [Thiotrichales bacterium 19X7-9]|nr:hypothetical protein [Thiotrichales bacterium 19X7-9]